MRLSVVVPCYRSVETLAGLVEGVHAELGRPGSGVDDFELVLVVDGSPDSTFALANDLARRFPRVRVLMLSRNYGQHNALLAGIERASFEVVVTMDDDLQHRPDQITRLVEPLQDPLVDLVYGVAVTEEHAFWRSLASRAVKRGLALAGVDNASDVSAFRAFRTELRHGFPEAADAFASVDVLLSWTTVAVTRVDVQMDQREAGESAYGLRKLMRHTLNMVTGYGTLPLRLVTVLGVVCAVLGAVLLATVLVGYFVGSTTVSGFTTLASMIALFSAAQMLSIGVLGEYVGRLHFRSMHKPTYVVRLDSTADPVAAEATARAMRQRYPSAPSSLGSSVPREQ
ncbi:glycosyltransferase [Jannaschia sp. R86511]|uniref:glycosyltransferase n=1 Tax=Jannaschia sp. R86511 TaxID=3093853 RepID=UPI0036D33404